MVCGALLARDCFLFSMCVCLPLTSEWVAARTRVEESTKGIGGIKCLHTQCGIALEGSLSSKLWPLDDGIYILNDSDAAD